MSDRYHSLQIVLDKDYKDEDAESIIDAIKMIKGVLSVEPIIAEHDYYAARIKEKYELINKIYDILKY